MNRLSSYCFDQINISFFIFTNKNLFLKKVTKSKQLTAIIDRESERERERDRETENGKYRER